MKNLEILSLERVMAIELGLIVGENNEPKLKDIRNIKLQYALDKNLTKIRSLADEIRTSIEKFKTEEFKQMAEEANKLIRESEEMKVPDNWDKKETYEKELDELETQINGFLDEEADFTPYYIDIEKLGDDLPVTFQQFSLLKLFSRQ